MDILDIISARRSVRKFLQVPIEWEKVARLLEAGRLAPSAGNVQDWKFIVIVDPEIRENVAAACAGQSWMTTAPVHIAVCQEPVKSDRFYGEKGKNVFSVMNAAAAIENVLLTAQADGLGACWVSAFDEERLKLALKVPPEARVTAVVPIGYPDESPVEPLKYGLDVTTFFDEWGARYKDMAAVKGEYDIKTQGALKKMKGALEKIRNGEIPDSQAVLRFLKRLDEVSFRGCMNLGYRSNPTYFTVSQEVHGEGILKSILRLL